MLVDKKILSGGLALLAAGMAISAVLGTTMPVSESGMTEEEVLDLLVRQQQNDDLSLLAGMMVGVGFLLILVSFGTRRRRRGGALKETKKPA